MCAYISNSCIKASLQDHALSNTIGSFSISPLCPLFAGAAGATAAGTMGGCPLGGPPPPPPLPPPLPPLELPPPPPPVCTHCCRAEVGAAVVMAVATVLVI